MDTKGVEPWAYMIVGGVQLATHSWMSHRRMSSDELIDYLTMLSWSALCGIVEVGGSLEKFNAEPHPTPELPSTQPWTRAQRFRTPSPVGWIGSLETMADLPSLWTHEPHNVLGSSPATRCPTSTPAPRPGFKGSKADAPDLQAERNATLRRTAGDALRQQPQGRHPIGPAGAAGNGHRGQGRHRRTCRRRGQSDGHPVHQFRRAHRRGTQAPLPVADPQRTAAARATSGCSTVRTTRTCSWCGCTTWCRRRSGAPATTRSTRSRRNSSTAARPS